MMPALEALGGARQVGADDRAVAGLQPDAGAEAVGERQVVLVDRLTPICSISSSAGWVPTHENQAGDSPAGARWRQAQRRPEVAGVEFLAGVPAGAVGHRALEHRSDTVRNAVPRGDISHL